MVIDAVRYRNHIRKNDPIIQKKTIRLCLKSTADCAHCIISAKERDNLDCKLLSPVSQSVNLDIYKIIKNKHSTDYALVFNVFHLQFIFEIPTNVCNVCKQTVK